MGAYYNVLSKLAGSATCVHTLSNFYSEDRFERRRTWTGKFERRQSNHGRGGQFGHHVGHGQASLKGGKELLLDGIHVAPGQRTAVGVNHMARRLERRYVGFGGDVSDFEVGTLPYLRVQIVASRAARTCMPEA